MEPEGAKGEERRRREEEIWGGMERKKGESFGGEGFGEEANTLEINV